MDRSVYGRLFVHESMVDILLDLLAGVAASFRSKGQAIFLAEGHLSGMDGRIGSVTRMAEEVYQQVGVGDDVVELDGRVSRVCAAMKTARDLVKMGSNPDRALRRYEIVADAYKRLRYKANVGAGDVRSVGECASSSEETEETEETEEMQDMNGYGRDSQEELSVNDVVDIVA